MMEIGSFIELQFPKGKEYYAGEKDIASCCAYIIGRVKKSGRNGFTDPEIYGMAVHYYDEDSIKVTSAPKAKVTAPSPTPAPKTAPAAPEKPKKLTKAFPATF